MFYFTSKLFFATFVLENLHIMSSNVIQLHDVSIYQRDHLVLSNVSIELRKGEFSYLIGKTGSGKSSLLKVLYGDLPLRKGEATIVGFDLNKLKTKDIPFLRRKIGIVFQDFQLLNDRTVYENLKFVLKATGWKSKNEMDTRIDEVLDSVGMKTKGFKHPYELSGGEQQRVVIARALLNKPELIIADEPTGNLDPETSIEIMNVIRQVSEENNCAVFMATHDFALIKRFPNKTFKCEAGKIVVAEAQSIFL
ncbi:putative phospholipid import ATP-binding protein MlaF [Flavobacteriaceae bacterium UJ101]|nr:putative phospholipid import ATP-binding protein MlaF [Flavobacteriaceae bacterium UJ101]